MRLKISSVTVCPLCQTQSETVTHLLAQCVTVRSVWARIETRFHIKLPRDSTKLIHLNFDTADVDQASTAAVVVSELVHAIWVYRNRVVFDAETVSTLRLITSVSTRLRLRVKAEYSRMTTADFEVRWGRYIDAVYVDPVECKVTVLV